MEADLSTTHHTENLTKHQALANNLYGLSLDNRLLVWLDPNINTLSNNVELIINPVRCIVNSIKLFIDPDECIDFISNIEVEKVFFIISNNFVDQILPCIEDINQIEWIYVYSLVNSCSTFSIKQNEKIKGSFGDIESLCKILQADACQIGQKEVIISVLPPTSTISVDELDQSYMYSYLLKEIIVQLPSNDKELKEFVDYIRPYHANETTINKFEQEYQGSLAIKWYTQESFIYETLNRALRIQDTNIILKMAFFLRDLHNEIKKLHSISTENIPEILYRGQKLNISDLEKIRNNPGGLLAFNNFLSTSADDRVAYAFADSIRQHSSRDVVAVLFQIKMNSPISSTIFASIQKFSNFGDDEQEILFSMNSVFRIDRIEQSDDRLWKISLILTNDTDQQLKLVTESIRSMFQQAKAIHQLIHFMIIIGNYDKAEGICNSLRENISTKNQNETCILYNFLGVIKSHQGELTDALSFHQQALDILQKHLPRDHLNIAQTLCQIGIVHQLKGQYSLAQSYFEQSLEIEEKWAPCDHLRLAGTYNCIGSAFQMMGEYPKALLSYKKTFEIFKNNFPAKHPYLATIHHNIGIIYYCMSEYSSACSYFERTLEIQRRILPTNHPHFAYTYNIIGIVQQKMGNYSLALSSFQQALEIHQISLPPNQLDIADIYGNIASVHDMLGNYLIGLEYFHKALKIKNEFAPNHSDIALSYYNIGVTHASLKEYSISHFYLEQALELQKNLLPGDHPALARTYNTLGIVNHCLGNYTAALMSLQQGLTIQEAKLSPAHIDLSITYGNLGALYRSMGDYATALCYYEKARQIQEKLLPSNHPHVITLLDNIKDANLRMRKSSTQSLVQTNHAANSIPNVSTVDCSTSLEDLLKILEEQKTLLPRDHPILTSLYNDIAIKYTVNREYSTALSYIRELLSIRERCYSEDHQLLARTYSNAATIYQLMGEYSEALQYYHQALAIQFKIHSPNHPDVINTCESLAAVYVSLQRYEESKLYTEQALLSAREVFGFANSRTKQLQQNFDQLRELSKERTQPSLFIKIFNPFRR